MSYICLNFGSKKYKFPQRAPQCFKTHPQNIYITMQYTQCPVRQQKFQANTHHKVAGHYDLLVNRLHRASMTPVCVEDNKHIQNINQ